MGGRKEVDRVSALLWDRATIFPVRQDELPDEIGPITASGNPTMIRLYEPAKHRQAGAGSGLFLVPALIQNAENDPSWATG